MEKLVVIKDDDIFTDSLIIAKGTENEYDSARKIIKKYENSIKELGRLRFKIDTLQTKQGGSNLERPYI